MENACSGCRKCLNKMASNSDIFNFTVSEMDSSTQITSKEDFVREIVPKVQSILNRMFPNNPAKRRIRVYPNRISFAAPCCGDSARNNSKKRGNIILDGKFQNMYKCFNCGTFMSIPEFFKTYGEDLSLSEIDYISRNKVNFSTYQRAINENTLSYIYDTDAIDELSIPREDFKNMLGLVEVDENPFIRNYLMNRRQYSKEKFLYSIRTNKLFVLNLTDKNNVFGIQVRSFNRDDGAKYKTYNCQKLHEIILRDSVTVPDDINTLSMLFNICLVDCTSTVTIVEGPMDSFLLRNSVALCGAAKNMEFPFMARFLFDDDKAGREHAIEKIREGYEVFLWEKFKKDLGLGNQKKWDVNDVWIWCGNNGRQFPSIEGYFSDDELDLIEI